MHFALHDKYPIETKEHVKTAMDYFSKYMSRFNHNDRVEFSCNIEKRANELNIPINKDWINNYTRILNKNAALSPDFKNNINKRKTICKSSGKHIKTASGKIDACEILDKIAEIGNKVPPIALIKTIEEFDKKAGLQYEYDKTILDPVMTVCGSLINSEYDAVKIAGDITDYKIFKLSKNSEAIQKLASAFGDKFINEFKNNPIETIINLNDIEKEHFVNNISRFL